MCGPTIAGECGRLNIQTTLPLMVSRDVPCAIFISAIDGKRWKFLVIAHAEKSNTNQTQLGLLARPIT